MKFVRIAGAKSVDGTEVTLRFVDKLSRQKEITLPRNLAFELTLVVRQALARAPAGVDDLRQSVVYTLAATQQLVAEGGAKGLILVTREGFQIPVELSPEDRANLRRAIDELDRPGNVASLTQH